MKKKSVQTYLLISNAIMVLVVLLIFLFLNTGIFKIFAKGEVSEFNNANFTMLFLLDGLACIVVLVLVSLIFTKMIIKRIKEPLDKLSEASKKIQNGNLDDSIEYSGNIEFEDVCNTFNEMQLSLKKEKEQNLKYEKARIDMVNGIAHDVRTPLTVIKGNVKTILDGIVTDEDKKKSFLETAYKKTDELDRLLSQLLYFSRVETGNIPMNIEKINISEFCYNYVFSKNDDNKYENIKFDVACDSKNTKIFGDAECLERIFNNLLENSVKYSNKTPLNININVSSNDNVHIVFKDNGIGVSEDKINRIFEEFYRVDESRNTKNGNGLGLYIVKNLVEAMGGSVSAYNDDGLAIDIVLKKERD